MRPFTLAAIAPMALLVAARPQGTEVAAAPSATYTITVGTPISPPFFEYAPIPGINGQLDWEGFDESDFCFDCPLQPSSYVNARFKQDPRWTVYYSGSKADDFSLLSFAGGCSANQTYTPPPGATGDAAKPGYRPQPIPCDITLYPSVANDVGAPGAAQTFRYTPKILVDNAKFGGPYPTAYLQNFTVQPYQVTLKDIRTLHFKSKPAPGYEHKVLGAFDTEISEAVYVVRNFTASS